MIYENIRLSIDIKYLGKKDICLLMRFIEERLH